MEAPAIATLRHLLLITALLCGLSGCQQTPPPAGSDQALTLLAAELGELRKEVTTLREQLNTTRERLEELQTRAATPTPTPSTLEVNEHDNTAKSPPPPAPPEPECRGILRLTLPPETDLVHIATVVRSRLSGWDLSRVAVHPADSPNTLEVQYASTGDQLAGVTHSLQSDDLLRFHWIVPTGLEGADVTQRIAEYAQLYPRRARELLLKTRGRGAPYLASQAKEALTAFADQILALPPHLSVVIEEVHGRHPDTREPRWRTHTIIRQPVLTRAEVLSAQPATDGDTPSVRLRFTQTGKLRLAEATRKLPYDQLAIVVQGQLATTALIQTPVASDLAEIALPANGPFLHAAQEAKRLGALINSKRFGVNPVSIEVISTRCTF